MTNISIRQKTLGPGGFSRLTERLIKPLAGLWKDRFGCSGPGRQRARIECPQAAVLLCAMARTQKTGGRPVEVVTAAQVAAVAAALPTPQEANPNRRVSYDPNLAAEICLRVSEGQTLRAIANEPGMPTPALFKSWCLQVPELSAIWTAARRLKASSLFDEALDISRELRDGKFGKEDNATINARRTAIDHLRWAASKLNPQEYGDRINDNPTLNIVINTNLDLGKMDMQKTDDGQDIYSITAKLPIIEVQDGAPESTLPAKSKPDVIERKHNARKARAKIESKGLAG